MIRGIRFLIFEQFWCDGASHRRIYYRHKSRQSSVFRLRRLKSKARTLPAATFEFLLSHRPDLIILSTHGREGLSRLLYGSKAEEIARRTHVPAIFIGPNANGFVDESTGQIQLRRILVPIAHSPSPLHSLHILAELLAPVGVSSDTFQFLHVGDHAPHIARMPGQAESHVEVVQGPIEETILRVAHEYRCRHDCHADGWSSWISGRASGQYDGAYPKTRAVPRPRHPGTGSGWSVVNRWGSAQERGPILGLW